MLRKNWFYQYSAPAGSEGGAEGGAPQGGQKDTSSNNQGGGGANQFTEQIDKLALKNQQLIDDLKITKDRLKAFDGFDVEAFKSMKAKFDESNEAELLKAGKIDELLDKRVEKINAQYSDKLTSLSNELSTLKNERDAYQTKYTSKVLDDTIRDAAIKAGVTASAINDVILNAKQLFTVDQSGEIEARDKAGNLVKTIDGMLLTPQRFLDDRREVSPHWWGATNGAGMKGGNFKGSVPDLGTRLQQAASSGDQVEFRRLQKLIKESKGQI